ncbi:hypothetical protein NDU88_006275 [Pleurodeles waltl]|uniref:Uncharacterized protein n=1 Tax=Pleurodeles waltl TaxID=8319 RepID=A0AAV7RL09_PLEWA|nr:hypothetical protein NDU88_006275 [Pleurodeles waltl]
MCRPDLANAAPPERKCGELTSARQILSPGAVWRRAALEMWRSRRAIAQAPLRGEAGRGRASTSEGWLSPGRSKAPLVGSKKVRRGNGVLEGSGKFPGAQPGRPLLWNTWMGAQTQGKKIVDPVCADRAASNIAGPIEN